MNNILDIKYNEIREIEKQYKLFIIKLHILFLTIDSNNITDEDKETIKKYVEEKIEIKHRIFQLYSDISKYCIDTNDYLFLLQIIKCI
jgi:hypothetical protein